MGSAERSEANPTPQNPSFHLELGTYFDTYFSRVNKDIFCLSQSSAARLIPHHPYHRPTTEHLQQHTRQADTKIL